MRPLQLGMVLDPLEDVPTGMPRSWREIRQQAILAEEAGFDTVWFPDELLWEPDSWPGARGFWECVAMTGAIAEATDDIAVGTWVLSALHRNPALTVKAVSTLDEIAGGRLIFGFGSGHSGKQGEAFGFAPDKTVGRYEEALRIVVPLLRNQRADFEGKYHRAALVDRPRGPRPDGIPLLLGGHRPRTIRLAVRYADIWSAFVTTSSQPEAFTDMLELVDRTCEEQGRDPFTLGRSVGVDVVPPGFEVNPVWGLNEPLTGSAGEIAATIQAFAEIGVTSLELMVRPHNDPAAHEALTAVLQEFDG